jgi:hypothetical protein
MGQGNVKTVIAWVGARWGRDQSLVISSGSPLPSVPLRLLFVNTAEFKQPLLPSCPRSQLRYPKFCGECTSLYQMTT